jgi:hypothetical protein
MKSSRDINPRRTLISIMNNQVSEICFHPALLRNINNIIRGSYSEGLNFNQRTRLCTNASIDGTGCLRGLCQLKG